MRSKLVQDLLEILVVVVIGLMVFAVLNFTMGDVWDNYFDKQDDYRQVLILESKGEL